MTDYEYILQQAKLFHYKGWEDGELRKCVDMLPTLSREELVRLDHSKWVDDKLRKEVINVLFVDKVGKREQRIKDMETDALIVEFRDKKSGNVALCRKELRERYKAGRDKQIIAGAFYISTKSDQQWMKWQVRKERYGNFGSNNCQWKKTSWK